MLRFGEIMDVNLPRDKETGKTRGFGFVMYEDQRSTVLAVDNLNGAKVLDRTLRVDHVKNYKQGKTKNEDGEWVEPEEQSLNAKPTMIIGEAITYILIKFSSTLDEDAGTDSDASSSPSIDPDDPMRDYLLAQRREAKALKKSKKSKGKGKHKDETPEERRARKARKKEKRARTARSGAASGVEKLLQSLGGVPRSLSRDRSRSPGRSRHHSRSPSPIDGGASSRRHSRSPHRRHESGRDRNRR